MKLYLRTFLSAVMAGFSICLGAAVNLASGSKVAGAILFSLGLFCVCNFKWDLFTGKVPYARTKDAWLKLPAIWIGNIVGAIWCGFMIYVSKFDSEMFRQAYILIGAKMSQPYLKMFLSAVLCNVLIYIAVEGYKECTESLGKHLAILLGVSSFVICGFEHCIADVAYAAISDRLVDSIVLILIATAGNLVGGVVFGYLHRTLKNNKVFVK